MLVNNAMASRTIVDKLTSLFANDNEEMAIHVKQLYEILDTTTMTDPALILTIVGTPSLRVREGTRPIAHQHPVWGTI
jgi:hypothetical protein